MPGPHTDTSTVEDCEATVVPCEDEGEQDGDTGATQAYACWGRQFSFGEIGTSAPWSMLLNVGAHSRAPSDARYDGYLLDFDVTKRDDFAIVLKVSYEAVMCLVLPSTTRFVFVVG